MDESENESSPDVRPGIPTWRFYLYALWLVGGALVLMLALVTLAPAPTSRRSNFPAHDMTALDAERATLHGKRTHEL